MAKQLLDESKTLKIPAVVANQDGHSHVRHKARTMKFDSAILEHRLGDIIPDVILQIGDRELLVEIAVTNKCDETKIARIRSLGISAIEIDLSALSRNASGVEIENAILYNAPRRWLYNPRVDEALAELQERLRKRYEQRIAPLRKLLKSPTKLPSSKEAKTVIDVVHLAGYRDAIGISVEGDICFRVESSFWQTYIIDKFVLGVLRKGRGEFHPVRTKDVFEHLRKAHLFHSELNIFISDVLESCIRHFHPNFQRPFRVVEAYLSHLEKLNILEASGDHWLISRQINREWEKRLKKAKEEQKALDDRAYRRENLLKLIERILEPIPEQEKKGFDLPSWLSSYNPDVGASPDKCIEQGGDAYDRVFSRLYTVECMLSGYSGMITDYLLGLPLGHERERRISARQKAEEKETCAREETARTAAYNRVSQLEDQAMVLGHNVNWIRLPCIDLKDRRPADVARESEEGLFDAVWALDRERQRRKRAQRNQETAEWFSRNAH
jgi:hypothetical protein